MVERKRFIERRKNKRYRVAQGAYAAISPNSNKIGQIIDISMGGFSFKYIAAQNQTENLKKGNKESIFLSSLGYYVGGLPFQTIADYEIMEASSFSSMKIRKRHVKFTDFTFKQLFDLDYYLKNNVYDRKIPY